MASHLCAGRIAGGCPLQIAAPALVACDRPIGPAPEIVTRATPPPARITSHPLRLASVHRLVGLPPRILSPPCSVLACPSLPRVFAWSLPGLWLVAPGYGSSVLLGSVRSVSQRLRWSVRCPLRDCYLRDTTVILLCHSDHSYVIPM